MKILYKGESINVRGGDWEDVMNSWLYDVIDKTFYNYLGYNICIDRDSGAVFALRNGENTVSENHMEYKVIDSWVDNDYCRHWQHYDCKTQEEARSLMDEISEKRHKQQSAGVITYFTTELEEVII